MKKILTLIVCAAALVSCGSAQQPTPIKVISYNIRMSAAPDADGDNRWENRKQASINMINDQQPTLLGLQEACPDQVAFLDSNLPDYKRIGVGREDGKAEGEMMAIYYRHGELEVIKSGTFWLSETPDEVSMGWDAACKRTCTWALFRSKADGRNIAYMNTHLDHMGPTARRESIKLIVAKIAELFDADTPLFLTADFNSPDDDPIFDPLKKVMTDARSAAPQTDNRPTFNDWGRSNDAVIDHIFLRGATPLTFKVLCDENYGAPYISDHYPVVLTAEY